MMKVPPKSYTVEEYDDEELVIGVEVQLSSTFWSFQMEWKRNENVPEWHEPTLHLALSDRSLLIELADFWTQLALLAPEELQPEDVEVLLQQQGFVKRDSWVKDQGVDPLEG